MSFLELEFYLFQSLLLLVILYRVINLKRKAGEIMATQAEHAQALRTLGGQIQKIGGETGATLTELQKLKDLLAAGGSTTPEVDDALAAATGHAQAADDLIPDAVVPPPPTP